MLRRMRPPPFQYAWTFYHDKHAEGASYEGRLTVLLENIITIKQFWEAYNGFPLHALKMKDSVHFFKRGVKPVWEDPRNMRGGAWTFRVSKDKSEQTWKELLLLAVGEQFADVIQPSKSPRSLRKKADPLTPGPGDDLCGLSLSVRFSSNLVTIWNRDGNAEKTIDGILRTVMEKISPELKPREGSFYYKKHSEHAGFTEAIANAAASAPTPGKIEEAVVQEREADKQMLEEAKQEEEAEREREKAQAAGLPGDGDKEAKPE
jgi:hypothetical protein